MTTTQEGGLSGLQKMRPRATLYFSTIATGQVSLALLELRAYRSKYEADTSSLRQMQKDSGSKTVAQRKRALVGAE
jgi:hypothetical protein